MKLFSCVPLVVSNDFICSKNIIFYQFLSRHVVSMIHIPLQLSKTYQAVVVTFSPNVS